jgi:hypothetical protein
MLMCSGACQARVGNPPWSDLWHTEQLLPS